MSERTDKILKDVSDLKEKNNITLEEIKTKADEANEILFKESCFKPYLTKCEPEYCTFRITNQCKYPSLFSKLKNIIE